MTARLVPLLTALALLTCPYACLAGSTSSTGDAGESASCCSRCAESAAATDHGESPEHEPRLSSCLCDGAILGDVAPLIHGDEDGHNTVDAASFDSRDHSAARPGRHAERPVGASATGRRVRVALSSFLS